MPFNSLFFPAALLEQVENEAFLLNFGTNKIIHGFRSSLLLIENINNNLYKLCLSPSFPKNRI